MRPTVLLSLLVVAGCAALGSVAGRERAYQPPPPPNYRFREIPFSDSDAFDSVLKNCLTNGTPAVRVVLDTPSPDFPPRLVAWLRAYQAGGKVRSPSGKGGISSLLWLASTAESPTEARQLLEGLLDRLQAGAEAAAHWAAREAERQDRIALLRPYILDAERDPGNGGNYVLILYNGQYD